MVLKAEKSKVKVLEDLMSGESWLPHSGHLLAMSSDDGRNKKAL